MRLSTLSLLAIGLVSASFAADKKTAPAPSPALAAPVVDSAAQQKIVALEKQIGDIKEALDLMTKGEFKNVVNNLPAIKAQIEQQRIQDSIAEASVYDIPLDGSPVEGPANAIVTIVEFSDMQCPYCIRSAPIVKGIFEKHPDQVRVIYKHFPLSFHDKSKGAHSAARAAEAQGKFFEFRYKLAEEAASNPGALDSANYVKIAQGLKLDIKKFKADMAISKDDEERFAKDAALGQKLGVQGTPSYFINGKRADVRTLEQTVEALIAAAPKGPVAPAPAKK